MADPPPHVVILGGGFGGLNAARALAHAPVRVTLIDRRNHHLFQPLLYQVATAALNPSDIAMPIRRILRRQENAEVIMAEATAIDLEAHWRRPRHPPARAERLRGRRARARPNPAHHVADLRDRGCGSDGGRAG